MTELELYKYVKDNNIEWHYHTNEGVEDVVLLPYYFQLEELMKIIGEPFEEGIECKLRNGYVGFWMCDIFEYYGLELENVFPKNEEQ